MRADFHIFGPRATTVVTKMVDKIAVEVDYVIDERGNNDGSAAEIFVTYAWEDEDYGYCDESLYLNQYGDYMNWEVA